MPFKEEIKAKLTVAAIEYQKLLNIDFIIKSPDFKLKDEYTLRFHEDNFLHLTGVETKLTAKIYYEKCLGGTLLNEDFDCESSSQIKGKVKEKLKHLVTIGEFFNKDLIFQEYYKKNKVECKLATSDGKCTLGFKEISNNICVPLTLLNKNQIIKELEITNFVIYKNARNKIGK